LFAYVTKEIKSQKAVGRARNSEQFLRGSARETGIGIDVYMYPLFKKEEERERRKLGFQIPGFLYPPASWIRAKTLMCLCSWEG